MIESAKVDSTNEQCGKEYPEINAQSYLMTAEICNRSYNFCETSKKSRWTLLFR